MGAKGSFVAVLGVLGGALLLSGPSRDHAGDALADIVASSYIVQGSDVAAVTRAIETAGGEVTHRLGIIGAAGARLTPAQVASLSESAGVRRIYADRSVRLSSVQTVRDEFNVVSYANNDGTAPWSTDWQEIGEADGPGLGFVKVKPNVTCTSGRCLYFDVYGDSGGTGVMREVDLSGAGTATLSFVWGTYYYNFGAQIALEVSADGGSWALLDTYHVNADRFDRNASFDLTPWASANTRIRFRVAVGDTGDFGVDNLEIVHDGGGSGDSGGGDPGGGSAGSETVRDELAAVSFSGNDGTVDFAAPWQEIGESNGTGSGYARVGQSNNCAAGNCLRIGAYFDDADSDDADSDGVYVGDRGVERPADLSGAASATLTFEYVRWGGSSGSVAARVEASGDGGATWTTLKIYALSFDDASPQSASFALEEHVTLGADTRVRFVVSGTYPEESSRYLYVDNLQIEFASTPDTVIPTLIGADQLHASGLDGSGVTVAVVDTGYWSFPGLDDNSQGEPRVLAQYDAIDDEMDEVGDDTDSSGHGTHVASLMMSSAVTAGGKYNGVAPGADLVSIKAFGGDGSGSYLDVIRGIDFAVANQATYGIRVLNLSFSAEPLSWYWDDPLAQAVMAAWQAGIVVVASAGNSGPLPMSIGVPGNVPYVLTPGAISDALTPADPTDDYLATWSSAGPTLEAFVKPDLVAPGGHALGMMPGASAIALAHPEFLLDGDYFTMSGTSQAAAVTSGVVALMLQADPTLSAADVKCKLMDSAHAAVDSAGNLAYSPFQQGAGLIDAVGAVASTRRACANLGLDLAADLAGTEHYAGPVLWDDTAEVFYVNGTSYTWDASFPLSGFSFTAATPWVMASPWVNATPWVMASPWVNATPWVMATPWVVGLPWDSSSYVWTGGLSETMSINVWVPQE